MGDQSPLGGYEMRQHLSDEKVHYKLYKDGKNWVAASIATGIAIPVALFSAVFLSPVHEVQATSDDLGYTYTAGQSDLSNSEVADGIKAGTVYDATSNGSSTVKIDNSEIEKIAAAHLQLTLNGNTWSLSPDSDFVKTSIDTVLTGLGYPTDAVSDPTSKTNAQSILDYSKKDGLQSVNGGSTAREDGNISWMVTPLISGSSLDMSGNQGGSINQADTLIGDTGFGAIIAGSLKVEDSDQAPFPTTNAQILLANHGYLNGTGSIPNGLINQLKQFSFADGSFASSMKRLQSATTQLMGLYSKTDGSAAVSFDQYNASTELDLDFSKAVKDANGDYVFTINSDTLKGNRYTFDWKNQAAYTGGNVIINYTGSSVINSQDTTNFKPDFLTGDNQIVLSVPNGNTINFTNADGPDQNHAVVLAPTSDVITNVGAYGGIVGAINGDGSNDGYDENTDPGNPINTNPKTPDTNVPDDPGNNPTKSTDTTKTPDDGGDTTTTTTSKTPESKAVTVNQTISTSVSDKDGIDPTDIPESDLPKNTETKSTTFTATVKDDGTVSYTNADGRISLEAPFNDVPVETTTKIGNTTYTVQVSGTLTDNSGLDEDTLDTKAVTDQIGQATDGTTLNWNISVVYFPSSTSKHKQVNFNNEVFFDYADDDFDSDPDNLPEDFTRTAVVSYVETTDSQGHSSYSDWQVEQSLDALTDANVPTMAGYRTNIENDITDDAIIGMLKSMGPINGASVTAETQVTYEKVVQLDDGIHVYTKAQQPGGVEQPSGTVGTNKPQGDPGDPLDTTDDDNNYVPDPDHVYTKAQQPGGVEQPSGTIGTNEPQGDPSDPLDTTDDNTNYVPDPDHVYTKAQQPGGVEQPSGTVGTNEPQGDPGDPLDTTDDDTNYVPDPDHVYTKAQQPDGVENMTTTPSGDDGRTTTTTPSGNDGQTTTTTTPSGDNDQTPETTVTTPATGNNGGLTTNTNTATPIQTTTPNTAAGTTQLRTGNGLTGQTPATSTTTVNPDGTTSRTLTYVDATQAPVATTAQASQTQTPAANAKTQTVDANKAGIPDQTATIADQANTPAVASPAESVTTVANVIDDNAELTHGNIFIAGGAPGMADYTFFSQPVMDSSTNSVDHYELLLRVWDSKQGGWHLPASFSIPASMEAHLMARAVAQLDVKDISINLTDAQFEDPDTQKAITDLAQSDAVDSLTVELATIPDSEELAANAKVFQAAGVKVTLDNLGSHTDGTQLANAADHVDTLKVSLRGMRRDGNNLTQMTNQLAAWQKAAAAHNDSLEVEGLETPEDLAMTNDLGITAVQGYYFSRPAMPGTRADLM